MPLLLGSAQEQGFLRVGASVALAGSAVASNRTEQALMLSARTTVSFLACPEEVAPCAQPPIAEQGEEAEVCRGFNVSFAHAGAKGKALNNSAAALCVGEWCSNTNLTATLGCVEAREGSFAGAGETAAGVWGLAPGGLHPSQLTLCFGTKRSSGRVLPKLDARGPAANWMAFTESFLIKDVTNLAVRFVTADDSSSHAPSDKPSKTETPVRVDFSVSFSFLPAESITRLRQSLYETCATLNCKGYRDFSGAGALACFRFEKPTDENSLPDLEWRFAQTRLLVAPANYLFTTDDGSRCIGIMETDAPGNQAVVGLNLLGGLRLRIDYDEMKLALDSCLPPDDVVRKATPAPHQGDIGLDFVPSQSPSLANAVDPKSSITQSPTDAAVGVAILWFVTGVVFGVYLLAQIRNRYRTWQVGRQIQASTGNIGDVIRRGATRRTEFEVEQDDADVEANIEKLTQPSEENMSNTEVEPTETSPLTGEANGEATPAKSQGKQ